MARTQRTSHVVGKLRYARSTATPSQLHTTGNHAMFIESWGDSDDTQETPNDWIWTGLLRPGQLTLLTALPKTGKTTLLAHLLSHRQSGSPLLDRPVRPGITAVITEEDRTLWRPRRQKLAFGRDVCFFYRPFAARPTLAEFDDLI